MNRVIECVKRAQNMFRDRMEWLSQQGGITEDTYARLLSMEYHLTNGVQRHFLLAASHPDLAKRRSLRKFLCDFANEEELHYQIAFKDLENMRRMPFACSIDVKLWKAYFDSVIYDRPFLRLGGTCILENISGGSREIVEDLIKSAKFLNEKNTRFIRIHQHGENIPHGEQVLEALEAAKLEEPHIADLIEGSTIATVMFIRMIDWCIFGDELKDLERRFQASHKK